METGVFQINNNKFFNTQLTTHSQKWETLSANVAG